MKPTRMLDRSNRPDRTLSYKAARARHGSKSKNPERVESPAVRAIARKRSTHHVARGHDAANA
jgi:hypothetical protein